MSNKETKKTRSKTLVWMLSLLFSVVTFMLLVAAWIYLAPIGRTALNIASRLGLPAGQAGGKIVFAFEVKSEAEQVGGLDVSSWQKIEEFYKLKALSAGKFEIQEKDYEAAEQVVFSNDPLYLQTEAQKGKTHARRTIVYPYLAEVDLALWYNKQENLEPEMHRLANTLLTNLTDDEAWLEASRKYSSDEYSKFYAGDTGLIDLSKAIPEFAEQVKTMELNRPQLVYTRYGIHIVEVLEKVQAPEGEYYHIREVVLRPKNYKPWLEQALDTATVRWYINPPRID